MDIATACDTVRQWAEIFCSDGKPHAKPRSLTEAVTAIRIYLEREKADGKPIAELAIAEHLLMTRRAVRCIMPFVFSAESIAASKRRQVAG